MRSRTKTFIQNAAVYVGLVAVLGVDLWFGMSYVRTQRNEEVGLKNEIKRLEADWKRKEDELKRADEKAAEYIKKIASRREELEGYGNFLPADSKRPEVQKFILQTIEDLHIKILRVEEIKLSPKQHYSTLDVGLSLRGTYRDFKLLLARIHKSEQFIRVRKFEVNTLDDEKHLQNVEVQFQTYFSAQRG